MYVFISTNDLIIFEIRLKLGKLSLSLKLSLNSIIKVQVLSKLASYMLLYFNSKFNRIEEN